MPVDGMHRWAGRRAGDFGDWVRWRGGTDGQIERQTEKGTDDVRRTKRGRAGTAGPGVSARQTFLFCLGGRNLKCKRD